VAGKELILNMDLSIVICTRNRASRLGSSLAALSALGSRRPFEVIWIDNGSTDETAGIIKSAISSQPHMKYHFCGQPGLGRARDFGWRQSTGRIVAFTDDDCYPEQGFVDSILEVFEERPALGCSGGRILLHNPAHAGVTLDERTEQRVYPPGTFLAAGSVQGANLVFRREALEAIGGIDPELGHGTPFPCEDIDAATAASMAGYEVMFDPRFAVRHDHGRSDADVPKLFEAYDLGRGAYYAKYMLRTDTRWACIKTWIQQARWRHGKPGLLSLATEMKSAIRYLVHVKRAGKR
jgi:GT2 family glycosyltransferase